MTAFIALPLVADTQAVKSPLFTVSRRLTKLLTMTRRGGILKA